MRKGKVAAAYAVNPAELTAWRSGKLVFNNASLSEVAAEVSRYREQAADRQQRRRWPICA